MKEQRESAIVILNEVKDLIPPPSRFFADAQNDKTVVKVKDLLTL